MLAKQGRLTSGPAHSELKVTLVGPAQSFQGFLEQYQGALTYCACLAHVHEHAQAPHPLGLLCPPSSRPRSRCAPEERDEFAAGHSMTSSASNCNDTGTSRPSALAVCILITKSNLVGCCTGSSLGFSPLRMR